MNPTPLPERETPERRTVEKAEMPTPSTPLPWWHRHPNGGNEIYPDGATHVPIAHFNSEADCDYAIAAANLFHDILRQRDELREALRKARTGLRMAASFIHHRTGEESNHATLHELRESIDDATAALATQPTPDHAHE
jgi:hypothetical protein